jgi:thioredoxin reductase (NADPH)
MPAPIDTEALIIGAGPVGLFQAFQLGLQGVHTHIVDALPHAGGQCAQLYADKPIYDIPGIPVCTGQELTQNLLAQLSPFKPQFHFGTQIESLQTSSDLPGAPWLLADTQGQRWRAKTVFIAAGVGAFVPRSLPIEGWPQHLGRNIWFANDALPSFQDQHLLVAGDGEEALQLCLCAIGHAASVTIMHRRDQFIGPVQLLADFDAAREAGKIAFVAGQASELLTENHTATGLKYIAQSGEEMAHTFDHLVMALGISPKLGPLTQWGLAMARKQFLVDPETFATPLPGVFAVGDINTYPGKKKLILCGFHEATLAAFAAMAILRPAEKTPLQYTTTSPTLQQRLGVR